MRKLDYPDFRLGKVGVTAHLGRESEFFISAPYESDEEIRCRVSIKGHRGKDTVGATAEDGWTCSANEEQIKDMIRLMMMALRDMKYENEDRK